MMMAMIERMGAHLQVGGTATTAMMLKMGTRRVVSNDDDDDNDREKGAHLRRRRVGDVVVDEVGDNVGDDNADVAKSERHQRRAKGTTMTTTTSKEGLTNIDDTNVDSVEDSERASLREGRRGGENVGDASGQESTNACPPVLFGGDSYIPFQSP